MQFKFYVLNWNLNGKKAEMFNIFGNVLVQEHTEKEIKKYLRSPKRYSSIPHNSDKVLYGFEALCEEIRKIIAWQEWSRCEYEILVGSDFYDKFEKWDCYGQAEPNIPMIVRECIYQYKKWLKEKPDECTS